MPTSTGTKEYTDAEKDPNAALALVSARPDQTAARSDVKPDESENSDPDLKRAKDLLALHANVKVAHQDGTDKDLNEAREAVAQILRSIS